MTSIYVGNLPFSANEDEIRKLFSAYGTVEKVWLRIARPDSCAALALWKWPAAQTRPLPGLTSANSMDGNLPDLSV
jgi:RNA recognition motif-containing protein